MKIAVIGGGLSGLTCLHKLAKAGVEAQLFEASTRVGGRIYTFHDAESHATLELGAGYFHKHYIGLLTLLEELDLTRSIEPKGKQGVAIVLPGKSLPISSPSHLLSAVLTKHLSILDLLSLFKLRVQAQSSCHRFSRWVTSFLKECHPQVDFHTSLLYDPWYRISRQKKFSVFIEKLSPTIQEFVRSMVQKQLFQKADHLSLAMGSFLLGSAATQLYILQGGMEKLSQKIYALYSHRIHLNRTVRSVSYRDRQWHIETDQALQNFDALILAVPIPVAQKLLGFDNDLEYSKGTLLVVRGSLKPCYNHGNNLYIVRPEHGISGITRYGENLFKVGLVGQPNLGVYFERYEIVHQHVWEFATPQITPHAMWPYASQIANLYFIGDYEMPCMEVAVDSATLVAEHMTRLVQSQGKLQ